MPVFVDDSGRRRLVLRWTGIAATAILGAYLVIVGVALVLKVTVPRTDLPAKSSTRAPMERSHKAKQRHDDAARRPSHRTTR